MLASCPRCGYATNHLKHYQQCGVAKSDWPAEYLAPGSAMPQVAVKIADAAGIRTVPVLPTVVQAEVAVTEPVSPTAPEAWASACCRHPQTMHIVSEDNVPPPTCLGCPDGHDEHDWAPVDAIHAQSFEMGAAISEYGTINSPLNLTCDCGYLARSRAALATHRRSAKQHRSA